MAPLIVTEDEDIGTIANTFVALPSFLDGTLRQCFEIPITDDSIIERDELFRLSLERIPDLTPANAVFVISETTVRIIDNDGRKHN